MPSARSTKTALSVSRPAASASASYPAANRLRCDPPPKTASLAFTSAPDRSVPSICARQLLGPVDLWTSQQRCPQPHRPNSKNRSTIRLEEGNPSVLDVPAQCPRCLRPKHYRGGGLRTRLLANAHPFQPPDHLVAKVRQLGDVIHQRNADAGQPGFAEIGKRRRDVVGIADDRQAAHALDVFAALRQIFLHPHR